MALNHRSLAALLALALTSCTPPRPPPASCTAGAGALVITEFLANPEGTDTGKEWFEIFNPGDEELSLAGLSIALAKADGTGEKKLTLPATTPALDAGGYFVFGDHRDGVQPAWMSFTYADRLGSMGNTGGKLSVACGTVEIDSAAWATAQKSGQSTGFDGAKVPNTVDNDPPEAWCYATVQFEALLRGSPGARNEECPVVIDPTTCFDPIEGARRPIRAPVEGDLVFTEVMPNPKAASDDAGEWIEVFAANEVDLNSVEVGLDGGSKTRIADTNCLSLTPGLFYVLARKVDPELNGGIEEAIATFSFDLPNSGDRMLVLKAGEIEVDRAPYSNPADGKSIQLKPELEDPASGNDAPESWCNASTAISATNTDLGTPGLENPECTTGPLPGTCVDPTTTLARAPVAPTAGQLVITEFMANPKAAGDDTGEWIELLATADFDLNGIEVRNEGTSKTTLGGADCSPVTAGSYILLARSTDPLLNGGLEAISGTFGFALANSGTRAIVVAAGATEIDRITYGTVADGASRQVDVGSLDAAANDELTAWCNGTTVLASTDKGTPGAENVACAP